MNKESLINLIAENAEISKAKAEKCLNTCLSAAEEALTKEEKIRLAGFGSFHVVRRAARQGVNPNTHEKVRIKASRTVKFRTGKCLKEKINAKKRKRV